jgi:Sigma-70, region 4
MTTALTLIYAARQVSRDMDLGMPKTMDNGAFRDLTGVDPDDVPRAVRALYELYVQGQSIAQAAAEVGIPARRASQLLAECGLPLRRQYVPTDFAALAVERREREAARARTRARVLAQRAAERERRRAARQQAVRERVEPMYELYESGATLDEVGARFGISGSRVSQLFAQAGLSCRPAHRRPRQPGERRSAAGRRVHVAHTQYLAGATLNDLGTRLGVSGARVSQLFQEAGLPTRAEVEARSDGDRR